ncbi:DUF3105 domain-containing protein [Cellulomonas triticagri]|uniref:DUF3105 domain-containing protein n=1 Tax=Cellulomonas triticagri TaxID=2483352 RepID=A0A3M2JF15_9CELL|nr:DUF3105 domain-containing protein [Cellulomonas triticagri]RMI12607.1 DUF3105 domain-containing protein [Cellulomonas triticagri]
MPDRRPTAAERQARLAAVRAEQRKNERRRTVLISSIAGTLVVALIAVAGFVLVGANREKAELQAQADAEIEGVQSYDGLTFNHVTTTVDYPQTPPAGGDHAAAWLNCGVYTEPVPSENAVHSLEHGAVWVTYDPSLPADEIAALEALADNQSYVLVTPFEGMESPITITAWGYQLAVDTADDSRIPVFIQKYLLNPELAEVGAPCSSGVGTPA